MALITVLQYLEDLSDRQAAEAVRSRIDWKYILGLKTSVHSSERKTWRGMLSFTIVFAKKDCLPCPMRVHDSRAKKVGRTLTLYPREQYEAQLAARQRQQTK